MRISGFAIAVGTACALLVPTHLMAAGNDAGPHTISVNGQAEVKAVPDEAQLSTGVVTQSASAAGALSQNARMMNGVIATLQKLGIPQNAIQTSDLSVLPLYQTVRSGNGTTSQKISGYQATNQVTVTIDDLHGLGQAIDALVESGANSLGGISFSIRDPKPLQAQARAAAVHDAMTKASEYAKAAGVQLGPIIAISESGSEPRPLFRAMAAGAPMASTPIATGEQTLSASVTAIFEIQ